MRKQVYWELKRGSRVLFTGGKLSSEDSDYLAERGYVHVGGLRQSRHGSKSPSDSFMIGDSPNVHANYGDRHGVAVVHLPSGHIFVRRLGESRALTEADFEVRRRFAPDGDGKAFVPLAEYFEVDPVHWRQRRVDWRYDLVFSYREV